jgi:hypothetical protein
MAAPAGTTATVEVQAVPGGTAVEAVTAAAVAVVAVAAAAVAGGNHDYFTIIFRQKLYGGENDVFLYKW